MQGRCANDFFYTGLEANWSFKLEIYMITHFCAPVRAMFTDVCFQYSNHVLKWFHVSHCPINLDYARQGCQWLFYTGLEVNWSFKLEIYMVTHFCAAVWAMLADMCFQSCHHVLRWFHVSHCPINLYHARQGCQWLFILVWKLNEASNLRYTWSPTSVQL